MKKLITVSIFGAPNSGKSTFGNSVLNNKVCIVSSKPNTTRDTTLAIYNKGDTQVVFLDTPGISTKRRKDEMLLTKIAKKTLNSSDFCLFLFDGTKRIPAHILEYANSITIPKVALINKVDLVSKGRLLPHVVILKDVFKDIFFGSALHDDYEDLLEYIIDYAKESEWDFPEDMITNRDKNAMINDRTQEAIFELMSDEIPYNTEVKLVELYEKQDKSIVISQEILISRKYKHIFLGLIKKLSIKSRLNLEKALKTKVHLFINLKYLKV